MTFDSFIEVFTQVQEDLIRDHGHDAPHCEILHRELRLNQTARDDAEQVASEHGLKADNIKLTTEHEELHRLLAAFYVWAQLLPPDQFVAAAMLVGRRLGIREANEMLNMDFDDLDTKENA